MYASAREDHPLLTTGPSAQVGASVRAARLRRGISVRQLARQLALSASFISQVENGRSSPSVATLRRMSDLLDVTIDDLLRRTPADDGIRRLRVGGDAAGEVDIVLLRDGRRESGRGAEPDRLTRHGGHEYGYVVRGVLDVVLGFETYTLRAGDSIAFDAACPHRLVNAGDEPLEAVWFIADPLRSKEPA